MSLAPVALPAARRHTWHFLRQDRTAAVHLTAEADVSLVQAERAAARERGDVPDSLVAHVATALGRSLALHPAANSAVAGRWRPRVVHYPFVDVKVAVDARLDDERIVLSGVLPDADRASRAHLQHRLQGLRADPREVAEFAGALALQRLPPPVGGLAFRLATRLAHRHRRLGTVSLTSFGHRRVQHVISSGGTTVTLAIGRVGLRPAPGAEGVDWVPVLPLTLTFDHRAIDGAEAADLLEDLLERLGRDPEPRDAVA